MFFARRYTRALEILKKAPTLEEIIILWRESNHAREQYALNKIKN